MKLHVVLPPAIIAGLLALSAGAQGTAPAVDAAHANCPTGLCAFIAAATPAPAPAAFDTCVVSGENFSEVRKPYLHVYQQAGKPDRVVPLCCQDCVKDFEKDPANYLAKLDAAAAAKTKSKPKG